MSAAVRARWRVSVLAWCVGPVQLPQFIEITGALHAGVAATRSSKATSRLKRAFLSADCAKVSVPTGARVNRVVVLDS